MDLDKLNYFKSRLLEEREKLLKSQEALTETRYDSMEMYSNELAGHDNHPGDVGTEVFMKEQDEGFKLNIKNNLREIEESLDLINEGGYGFCSRCQREIARERLDLIPYVKTCLECSEEGDDLIGFRQYESLEDEYSSPSNVGPESNVIYDREDTYQDIAADNIVPGDPSMSTGDNLGLSDEDELNI